MYNISYDIAILCCYLYCMLLWLQTLSVCQHCQFQCAFEITCPGTTRWAEAKKLTRPNIQTVFGDSLHWSLLVWSSYWWASASPWLPGNLLRRAGDASWAPAWPASHPVSLLGWRWRPDLHNYCVELQPKAGGNAHMTQHNPRLHFMRAFRCTPFISL